MRTEGEQPPEELSGVIIAYTRRRMADDIDWLYERGGMEGVQKILGLKSLGGLTNAEVEVQRQRFGPNTMPQKKTTPLMKLIWIASSDPMLRVLMAASIVSTGLALGFGQNKRVEWIEGFAILLAVLIVIGVTAGNDFMKEKQFAHLYSQEKKHVQVFRGGCKVNLLTDELVAGDLMYLEAGDEVPGDSVMTKGDSVACDESSLTGEPEQIAKASYEQTLLMKQKFDADAVNKLNPLPQMNGLRHHLLPSPVLLAGSMIATGSANALVVAVGTKSQMGQLFQKLIVDTEPTSLQNKLNGMARDVGLSGFAAALVTFIVLAVEQALEIVHSDLTAAQTLAVFVKHLVTAITIVVVAVPEGLPLAVTISLAFSVNRMLRDQNYVRRLAACECMGGATDICSDKTGTLTKNQMQVERLWDGSMIYTGSKSLRFANLQQALALAHNIGVNSSGFLLREEVEVANKERKMVVRHVGSATDCALLHMMETVSGAAFNLNTLRRIYEGEEAPDVNVLACFPHSKIELAMPVAIKSSFEGRGASSDGDSNDSFNSIVGQTSPSVPVIPDSATRSEETTRGRITAADTLDRMPTGVLRSASLCSPGPLSGRSVSVRDPFVEQTSQYLAAGNPLKAAAVREIFSVYNEKKPYILRQIPFSSERKFMVTVVLHPSDPQKVRLFVKGASEVVIRRCTFRSSERGVCSLTEARRQKIETTIIRGFASEGLRTLCMAYRDFDRSDPLVRQFVQGEARTKTTGEGSSKDPALEQALNGVLTELIVSAIVGIRDPLREEVPAAIAACKMAGIKVRMCTGDNIETAKSIAIEAGIYHPEEGGLAMLGSDFLEWVGGVVCKYCRTERCPCERDVVIPVTVTEGEASAAGDKDGVSPLGSSIAGEPSNGCCEWLPGFFKCGRDHSAKPAKVSRRRLARRAQREDVLLNQEEFETKADKLEVLARSQPADKYALVIGLRNMGKVVAVTGDGTNDAPALKKADVGFAMGITGKETAKQAADIVLMDDNFSSIICAIKWGRNVYDNIQRFIQFQLTVNIVAVITSFIGACFLRGSPLTAVQLLWVNLIMDTFAALALATEAPSDDLLNRPPHSRTEYLVSRAMWRNIILQVLYQATVLLFLIFHGDCVLPEWPFKYDETIDPSFTIYSSCGDGHVRSGRLFHPFTEHQDYKDSWRYSITPSRHYTYIFNIFVMMQLFNLVNARRLEDINIFKGITKNPFWIAIIVIIVVGQALLVEFGNQALSVHKNGLTWQQWLICIVFGLGSMVVAFLGKLIPAMWLMPQSHAKEVNPLTEPANLALVSRGRISSGRITRRMNLNQGVGP